MSRYNINNNRYVENEEGSYYANKAWRNKPQSDDQYTKQYLWFCASTQEYKETTRHPDGCFKCPRCKLHHYVVDNYELLCDTCVSIVSNNDKATQKQLDGIKLWQDKKVAFWAANSKQDDVDILARLALRDKLVNETQGLMFTS